MSSANILGSNPVRGTVCSDDVLVAYGTAVVPAGAGPNSSPPITVPFLKATDVIITGIQTMAVAGNPPVGAVTTPLANAGLVNASFTITVAGAVAQATTYFYFVLAGETA